MESGEIVAKPLWFPGIHGKRGQPIRVEELYERYAHLVYGRCLAMLGNRADAEDALQEVFVKAMRSMESFRGDSAPQTWLYRISTNHCLNVIRSSKRLRLRLKRQAEEVDALKNVGIADSSQLETATLIRELLPHFDERSQQMAVYYFVDGMNLQEVAQQLDTSVPTVRKYLKKLVSRANRIMEREVSHEP